MSIPNLRAIRDWCVDIFQPKGEYAVSADVKDIEDSLTISGERVYLDYQNGKYGCNTDRERGADTFIPFKSESGGNNETNIETVIQSPVVSQLQWENTLIMTQSSGNKLIFCVQLPIQDVRKIKRLILKSVELKGYKSSSSGRDLNLYLRLYGVKSGEAAESIIKQYALLMNATSSKTLNITEEEIDLTGYESVKYFQIYKQEGSSGSTYTNYIQKINVEIETYF